MRLTTLILLGLFSVAVGDITFVGVGDWGDSGSSGQTRQRHVATIMDKWCEERTCDFILALGDNFYPDGAEMENDPMFETRWKQVYTGDSIKDLTWYITVGNHDHINGNEQYQLMYGEVEPRWYFPWYYYSFEVTASDTRALFYAMDSESLRLGKHDPVAQMEDMEKVLKESDAPWKIVFGHHPPFSVGRRWGDQTIKDQVVPVCEENDVDAILAGHDHNLQHIVRSDNPDIEYIVSGAGGRSVYGYEKDNEDIINGHGYEKKFFDDTYGFVGVTLSSERMTVEYYDYTLEGDTTTIRELYSFTRSKV